MFKRIQRLFFGKQEKHPTGGQIIMPQEVVEALKGTRDVLQYPPAENGFPARILVMLCCPYRMKLLSKSNASL